MTHSRSSVLVVSRFRMSYPVVRYRPGSVKFSYPTTLGYNDSDYVNQTKDRRFRFGYVFVLFGGAISWASKMEDIIAQSSTEAEYIACCEAAKEGIWNL